LSDGAKFLVSPLDVAIHKGREKLGYVALRCTVHGKLGFRVTDKHVLEEFSRTPPGTTIDVARDPIREM